MPPCRGRGLEQLARQVARFRQQEQANLRDVRSGGDVNEIVFRLRVERISPGEVVQCSIDLLEVPRVFHRDEVGANLGLGRNRGDVGGNQAGQLLLLRPMEQLKPANEKVLVLADRDARPPRSPAIRPHAGVQSRAEQPEDDSLGVRVIHEYKSISRSIVLKCSRSAHVCKTPGRKYFLSPFSTSTSRMFAGAFSGSGTRSALDWDRDNPRGMKRAPWPKGT